MSAGRTTWWPKDAAWHRRERLVELGEEHGPGGATVLDVLCAWAQEQRADGAVRGGFRTLAREAFVTVEQAREIVRHAAEIGAIDELEVDDDGRRFTCRISGWQADQARGRAAIRKADQRSGRVPSERDSVTPEGDSVTSDVTESRSVPLPNQTKEEEPPYIPPQAGGPVPTPPSGVKWDSNRGCWSGRERTVSAFRTDLIAYGQSIRPGIDERTALKLMSQAVTSGCDDDDSVEAHIAKWWPHLGVAEAAA